MVKAQEAEFGVNFTAPDLENGPTTPLSLKRTFGSTEPIRVKLYRDHAGAQQQQQQQQQQHVL
jgi:glutathione S-transferase